MNLERAFQILAARAAIGSERLCILCGHRVRNFLPYSGGWRKAPALMRALEMVGSDLDQFECPWCGSHDRERHLVLYMRAAGIMKRLPDLAVLHFAPERHLSRVIAEARPRDYRKADLFPMAADVERMNLMAIPCDAESFDLVIANHVLEHVDDDICAVREVHRVLKPGGYAILQTPYSAKLLRTWSDAGVDSDAARLQAFGQEDHVRLFGQDILARFESGGLVSSIGLHDELLKDCDPVRHGVNRDEPFFLFRRLL